VEGPSNSVYEIDVEAEAAGPDNPWGNAFVARATALEHEQVASGSSIPPAAGPGRSSTRPCSMRPAIRSPTSWCRGPRPPCWPIPIRASDDEPVSPPATSGSPLMTRPSAGPPATIRTSTPVVTGFPRWTAADRSLVDTDLVLWHTFGVTHIVRPEQWPVMPVGANRLLSGALRLLRRQPGPRHRPGAFLNQSPECSFRCVRVAPSRRRGWSCER